MASTARRRNPYAALAVAAFCWQGWQGATSFAARSSASSSLRRAPHARYGLGRRRPQQLRQQTVAVKAAIALPMPVTSSVFNGAGEALATILVSELGDKTFFLTMILAMRRSRRLALLSSQVALWIMMLVSTSIGVLLRRLTLCIGDALLVRVAAAALMIAFGIQSFREVQADSAVQDEDCDEKDEAECQIDGALQKAKGRASVFDVFRFALLIFLAEWGDRSMLATITLATTKSPIGIFCGGCVGHLLAGTLAVVSGGLLEEYVSDRMIKLVGGSLFLAFGITTLIGVY
eukprot:gb/GFBE01014658.1/.p1 GENE.gb/GFBE01014658.1/~~gb/GFBE01014658.1/.p1  ORF type:complete len:290 (+),score=46.06 gb/GFBE01014658.1/:1-870(+)